MIRLLLVTHEPIGHSMAGPAIRVVEMARALAADVRPTIATPYPPGDGLSPTVAVEQYQFGHPSSLARLSDRADVVLVQGFTLQKFPFLAELDVPIVVDLYCPFHLENLERLRAMAAPDGERRAGAAADLQALIGQISRGDFFLCANERQRDLWLGMITLAGRMTPDLYAGDPELRQFVDVVPFGVPSGPPERTGPGIKQVTTGIAADDRLIVWGGSVLEWQDPLTLVEAMRAVADRMPRAKLVLPGGPHPIPDVPPMPILQRTRERAEALGLLDRHVFFAPWVPYDRRANYLLEAEVGVSTHLPTLETRFAWRTRMLDYVWAGLPIVCTDGDSFADLVTRHHLGLVVQPRDRDALAEALIRLIDDPDLSARCRANAARLATTLQWGTVVEPLRRFLRAPRRQAADTAPRKAPAGVSDRPQLLRRLGRLLIGQ